MSNAITTDKDIADVLYLTQYVVRADLNDGGKYVAQAFKTADDARGYMAELAEKGVSHYAEKLCLLPTGRFLAGNDESLVYYKTLPEADEDASTVLRDAVYAIDYEDADGVVRSVGCADAEWARTFIENEIEGGFGIRKTFHLDPGDFMDGVETPVDAQDLIEPANPFSTEDTVCIREALQTCIETCRSLAEQHRGDAIAHLTDGHVAEARLDLECHEDEMSECMRYERALEALDALGRRGWR